MGIGGSVFLIAVGAIIAFGVHANLGVLNLQVIGWVIMLAGVFLLILTLWFWNNRRRAVVTRTTRAAEPVRRTYVEQRRTTADPALVERRVTEPTYVERRSTVTEPAYVEEPRSAAPPPEAY